MYNEINNNIGSEAKHSVEKISKAENVVEPGSLTAEYIIEWWTNRQYVVIKLCCDKTKTEKLWLWWRFSVVLFHCLWVIRQFVCSLWFIMYLFIVRSVVYFVSCCMCCSIIQWCTEKAQKRRAKPTRRTNKEDTQAKHHNSANQIQITNTIQTTVQNMYASSCRHNYHIELQFDQLWIQILKFFIHTLCLTIPLLPLYLPLLLLLSLLQ